MMKQRLEDERVRCDWAKNELAIRYHDEEWGRPVHDEARLFEFIVLEGAQAGLSWDTILRKREGYRRAFLNFEVKKIAEFSAADVDRLVQDQGIVRHRGKIESVIKNARATLTLYDSGSSLDQLLWSFVDGQPQVNHFRSMSEVPARTERSDQMAKALKKLGFGFVGSTTCYALMQATGMVDDHLSHCFCRAES